MRTLLPWEPVEGIGLEPTGSVFCSRPESASRELRGCDSGQRGDVALAQEAPRSWAREQSGHAEATLGRGPEDLSGEAQSDLRERWPSIFQPSPERAVMCTCTVRS